MGRAIIINQEGKAKTYFYIVIGRDVIEDLQKGLKSFPERLCS